MNATGDRQTPNGNAASGGRMVPDPSARTGMRSVGDAATPMPFLPPYARRFQAYRNPDAAIRATKGWDNAD